MTKVFFCYTNHQYQPYEDLFRLAELSGFKTVNIHDIDPDNPDHTYIFSPANGEIEGWHNPQATIIHWLLEWGDSDMNRAIPGVAATWVSNLTYRSYAEATRFVPIGSHPELTLANTTPYEEREFAYDVALMAYRNPRRQGWIDDIERAGLSVAPDGWGEERDRILMQSRMLVYLYQHDQFPAMAPLRPAIAAAYGLPIVTEACPEMWSLAPLQYLPRFYTVKGLAAMDNASLTFAAQRLHEHLCKRFTFRQYVMKGLGYA